MFARPNILNKYFLFCINHSFFPLLMAYLQIANVCQLQVAENSVISSGITTAVSLPLDFEKTSTL